VFTGIIEQIGRIARVEERGDLIRLEVGCEVGDLVTGGSIAVDGCCLTATDVHGTGFSCDLTPETLLRTAFGERLLAGRGVNLERPLRANGRFDGHIVQGHVDGVGRVGKVVSRQDSAEIEFEAPVGLERYLVPKGSIAVDGVSLTVVEVRGTHFTVAVIPYTLEKTTLGAARPGELVNLEMDILAKYVESLLRSRERGAGGAV
jgi:riboflavin synthase